MEFKTEDFILGFWLGSCKEHNSDFLMTVLRRGETWHVEYRFRYHVDNLTFDSKDRKQFYSFKFTGTEGELMKGIDKLVTFIKAKYQDLEFHEVRGGFDEFRYAAALCPEMQFKTVSSEELKKIKESGT